MLLADLGATVGGYCWKRDTRDRVPAGDEASALQPKVAQSPKSVGSMLRFPVHPRYARMLLAAEERGCVRPVALMAALTQGRNFLLRGVTKEIEQAREDILGEEHESDFFLLMRAWRFADQNELFARGLPPARHPRARCASGWAAVRAVPGNREKEGLDTTEQRVDGAAMRKCVLAGFSDQLAKRLDAGTLRCELVHHRRGVLARESCIQKSPLLVAAEISEIEGRGGEVNVLLSLATAIEEPWLKEIFPDDYREMRGVVYDEQIKRVVSRRERRFRDLVLEAKVEQRRRAAQ